MKSQAVNFRHSILFKVILLFLTLSVPLFLVGSGIYRWGYGLVKKEIESASISRTSLYAKSLEDEISRILLLETEYVSEDDLNYLINAHTIMDQFELFQYISRVQSRLSVLKNSSSIIQDITIHIPRLQKTISSQAGVLPLSAAWEEVLDNQSLTNSAGLTFKNNSILLDMTWPVMLRAGKTPLFAIEIRLSNRAIRELLNGFSTNRESVVFLTGRDRNYLLASAEGTNTEELLSLLPEKGSGSFDVKRPDGDVVLTYTDMPKIGMSLACVTPTREIYGKITRYRELFILYIALFVLTVFLFSWIIRRVIHQPVKQLADGFMQLESGRLGTQLSYTNRDEFQYLYHSFNKMSYNLEELIHQVYEQKILVQKAELKQLQSQINPHFLYNSFFNIYRMAKDEDYENITAFSQYLGAYYEYITRNASLEVTLKQEYDHALTYCRIQGMRFKNRLTLSMETLPETVCGLRVPKLIVQPIIENTFEHGLKNVEQPLVRLFFSLENDLLSISIEDNGPFLPDRDMQLLRDKLNSADTALETTAIINIHRRLTLKFGRRSGIRLARGRDGGLLVTLLIPIPKEDTDV